MLTAANRDLVRLWETGVRELPSTPGWPASRWNEVRWAVFAPSGRQWMVGVREGNATNAYVLGYPNPSEATRLEGHRTNVVGAVFGSRGERVVTADAAGRLAIRDAPAWNAGRWIETSPSSVRGMALSPDGRWFAVADGNAVRVLDAADWRETVRLEKHGGPVLGVAFGSDSRVLASAGADAKVHLWRVPEWTPLVGDGVSHGARVNAVAFSPGERLLGTASDEIRLLLWNDGVRDRERMGRSSKEDSGFVRLAFTPSGECAISTDDSGWVELWDVAMHRRVGYLPQAKSGGEVIAVFTPDERELVAVGAGGMGLVYESVAWRSRRELVAETDRR